VIAESLLRIVCRVPLNSGCLPHVAPLLALIAVSSPILGCFDVSSRTTIDQSSIASEGRRHLLLADLQDASIEARDSGSVALSAVDIGGERRAALWAHAPTRVSFSDVSIPAGALLHVGAGIAAPLAKIHRTDGVVFEVKIVSGGQEQVLWSRHLDPAEHTEDRRWVDIELDLAPWAGTTVDLVFSTHSRSHRVYDHSAWSRLVIAHNSPDRTSLDIEQTILHFDSSRPQSVRLPAGARLRGASIVEWKSGSAADRSPIHFLVKIDGKVADHQRVLSDHRWQRYPFVIDLDHWAGQEVVFDFEVEHPLREADRTLAARFDDLAIAIRTTVPRRLSKRGPNILFLLVDTLRADHVGAYGYPRATTPNLDVLASAGSLFEQPLSPSSWTMPATASILTGLYPPEHGVTDGQRLDPALETVPEHMQRAGLATFGISANPLIGEPEGFDQGFEDFIHIPWASADVLNEVLFDLLRRHDASRWFGYTHYIDPHDPYSGPEPFGSMFLESESESPFREREQFRRLVDAVNFGRGTVDWRPEDLDYLRSAYDGEIRFWDSTFARLLVELDRLGIRDNTVIVVTSDHGEEFLDHGKLKHGFQLYEELVRVPLILNGPGIPVMRYRKPVATQHLFDLLLDWIDSPPTSSNTTPLGPLLRPDGPLFTHTDHGKIQAVPGRVELMAIRDGRWKLIRIPRSKSDTTSELYDLEQDPEELHDLRKTQSRVSSRLERSLTRWEDRTQSALGDAPAAESEILDKLRSLGYIE